MKNDAFSASEAANIAGVEIKSVSAWCDRELILGVSGGGSKGKPRLFSMPGVVEIAVAAALMDAGLKSPRDAFAASGKFAHAGLGGSSWGDGAIEGPTRRPALPFHPVHGTTWLIASGEKSVVLAEKTESLNFSIARSALGAPIAFIALDISRLFKLMAHRMDLNAEAELDAIYPDDAARMRDLRENAGSVPAGVDAVLHEDTKAAHNVCARLNSVAG